MYQTLSEKEKNKQREYGYRRYKNLLENEKQILVDDRKTIIKGEKIPCYNCKRLFLVRKFVFFLGFSYNQWQNIMGITLSPYTTLRTHNIAWHKFCSLYLNIVKTGKGTETQNCLNSSFSHNFCHWLSEKTEKYEVWYFTVAWFKSNWRRAVTHYVIIT